MTDSLVAVPHTAMEPAGDGQRPGKVIIGDQRPRMYYLPPAVSYEAGQEAVELSAASGLVLDDWQSWSLTASMGTQPDGRWAAFEVGMIVSRQNGKNAILEARELAALFLTDEALTIHTAHEFKAAQEQFRRLRSTIENRRSLIKRIKTITTSHGDEAIELLPTPTLIMGSEGKFIRRSVSPRLRFLARSRGSGRSFTCDLLVWDEAMILSEEQVGAAMPTLSAVWNPQLWYTGSAGDQTSIQLARVRGRGVAADARRRANEGLVARPTLQQPVDSLAFFEWSISACHEYCRKICPIHRDRVNCTTTCSPACPDHDDPHSVTAWAKANPGLGIRISPEHVQREMASMSPSGVVVCPPDTFARERLTVGNWPTDENAWAVIAESIFDACADKDSPDPVGPICLCPDVTPDSGAGSIAVVGKRPDGKIVAQIPKGDHRSGTAWIVPRLVELKETYKSRVCAIVIDKSGPAHILLDDATKAGLDIPPMLQLPTLNEVGQAFGIFYRGIHDRDIVHLGAKLQPDLRAAVAGAQRRDIGDGGHAWARKATTIDISPLVAATLGVWGFGKFGKRSYDVMKSIY